MLDDLQMIHERDASDALGIAEKQPEQYLHDFHFAWEPPKYIRNVVLAGMGGSALAAKAFKQMPGLAVPFEIVQDYELPGIVTAETLCIASSYSGNTEETVTALEAMLAMPEDRKPMIIVIACGGKLGDVAHENNLPFIELPGGFQPRHTFGYQYRALAEVFQSAHLHDNFVQYLEEIARKLPGHIAKWVPTVHTGDNQAKQIALDCLGKSIVVYSGPKLAAAAYKWKISFNENAKAVAWWNSYPEFNHNELLGWTKQPEQKPYTVIDLRSSFEHPQVQKRFEVSARLLSGLRPEPIVVNSEGDSLLEQLLSTIAYGDFVSIYLALLGGLNPTPVELIEKFKHELVS